MKNLLDTLRELQELDREILRNRRFQRELPGEVDQKSREMREIDRMLEAKKNARKEAGKKIHAEEGEMKVLDDRIKKLQGQTLDVKTNKEYKAIMNEIANIQSDKGKIEDKILEAYQVAEGIDREVAEIEERKKGKQKEVDSVKKRADQDVAEFGRQIVGLEAKRKVVAERVRPETLALYEELLEDKEGVALAPVVKAVCQGCNFRLLPNVLNRLTHTEVTELVKCSHCGRLLYLKE